MAEYYKKHGNPGDRYRVSTQHGIDMWFYPTLAKARAKAYDMAAHGYPPVWVYDTTKKWSQIGEVSRRYIHKDKSGYLRFDGIIYTNDTRTRIYRLHKDGSLGVQIHPKKTGTEETNGFGGQMPKKDGWPYVK